MHRLDTVLSDLDSSLDASANRADTETEISTREKTLGPLYTQIAHEFADLHDRSGRMKAKGCITDELTWRTSRTFFFWRIRRRQAEDGLQVGTRYVCVCILDRIDWFIMKPNLVLLYHPSHTTQP